MIYILEQNQNDLRSYTAILNGGELRRFERKSLTSLFLYLPDSVARLSPRWIFGVAPTQRAQFHFILIYFRSQRFTKIIIFISAEPEIQLNSNFARGKFRELHVCGGSRFTGDAKFLGGLEAWVRKHWFVMFEGGWGCLRTYA